MTQGGLPTGGSHAEPEEAARTNFYRLLLQQVITMFNTGDTVSAWRVYSSEYVDHQKPTFIDADGPEEFITIVALARRSLPNLRVSIEEVLIEGDKVVARLRWHSADAQGRTIDRESIEILRFEDDHVAEHWGSEVSSADSAAAGEPGAGSY